MLFAHRPIGLLAGAFAASLTIAAPLPASAPAVVRVAANEAIDQIITGAIAPTPATPAKGVAPQFLSALELLAGGDQAAAYELARSIPDDTQRRAIQWAAIYYGNGAVPSASVERFKADAPDFAASGVFKTRLEQALIKENAAGPDVIKALGGAMPNTIDAQVALALAYLADGQRDRAARIARSIWVNNFLERAAEDKVLKQLGALLTRDDHWARAEHLMMNDRAAGVERLLDFMTPAQKSLAIARNAVSRNAKDAKKLLDAVDPAMQSNPIFAFSRAERARQFELWDDAISWLNKTNNDIADADLLWNERRTLIRQLLASGEVKRAFRAADSYRGGPEGRMVEAHFHAGWIALSFLKDNKSAVAHFEAMAKLSTLPDSLTQADFWLGRARSTAGDTKGAAAAWRLAAEYGTLYYGQLARAALGEAEVALRPMPPSKPAEASFEARDLVRAVRLLADNGHKEMAVPLLRSFATTFKDGGELALAARLAQSLDAHHLAITIADTAERRGTPLDLFNFPKDGLPQEQLAAIDKAAVYAIARQESRFQTDAISSAGARGLMQLMPTTAKETAGKLGVSYSASRLTTDGAYNALLGSTYLKTQLDSFDGSLLLAAAAYNAGAGNARKWIATFGDPRSADIDPVVWVELIPVQETRKYVQRVLGNYMVYRARLGHADISIAEALRRIPD